jgi:integrase
VRQKKQGRNEPWWIFVTHRNRRTSRCVGSKAAALKAQKMIEAQLAAGTFDFGGRERKIPLFKDFAQGYLETYSAMNHKESTHKTWQQAVERHLIPFFGNKPLDEISRQDVKAFIAAKQVERHPEKKGKKGYKLSPATIQNLKAYLSGILQEAVDDELIANNPASRVGKYITKKSAKAIHRPLSWDEVKTLEAAMQEHFPRYYPIVFTALRTGMRLGELIALKPGDLDFEGRFIEVRRSMSRGQITTPKSGKTRRVDMSNGLVKVLKDHLTQRKVETLKKGWREQPEFLFYNGAGNPIEINGFRRRVFYKALEKAGIRQVRFHDLRHSYATLRASKGDNILDISKQLGHSSIKITMDIYSKHIPGEHRSQVDALDGENPPKNDEKPEAVNGD